MALSPPIARDARVPYNHSSKRRRRKRKRKRTDVFVDHLVN
jgi:hypothetical protein